MVTFLQRTTKITYFCLPMNAKKSYTVLFHFFFWVGISVVMFLLNARLQGTDHLLLRVMLALALHAILVYTNLALLLPRLFFKRKFVQYAFVVTILLAAFTWIRVLIDQNLSIPDEKTLIQAGGFYHILGISLLYIAMLAITSSLTFLIRFYEQKTLSEQLKSKQLEAELKFLRAQVNPHFLFNVLNNIYSLSFYDASRVPTVVLKLSEMMRYLLHETNKERVSLSDEIQYLENYIALHQLRTEEVQNVEFNVESTEELMQLRIPPLLFLPLIENCYKHGNVEDTKQGWMKIQLRVNERGISFRVSNSIGTKAKKQLGKASGTGLKHLRERLELLFPGKYHLDFTQDDSEFTLNLKLEL